MGNIIKMADYTTKYRIIDVLDPNFIKYSRELQKQYPVLKYFCTKSKYNKLKIEYYQVIGNIRSITNLPEPYYDYMCCDLCNEYLQIYFDKNQYKNSKNPEDCIQIKMEAYNKKEKYAVEYYFMISKGLLDKLSERMRGW